MCGRSTEGMLSSPPYIKEDDMGPPEVLSQLSSLGIELAVIPERWHGQAIVEKVTVSRVSSVIAVML